MPTPRMGNDVRGLWTFRRQKRNGALPSGASALLLVQHWQVWGRGYVPDGHT